jgi:hypothetical protein
MGSVFGGGPGLQAGAVLVDHLVRDGPKSSWDGQPGTGSSRCGPTGATLLTSNNGSVGAGSTLRRVRFLLRHASHVPCAMAAADLSSARHGQ